MAEYIKKEPLLRKAKELQGGSFSSPLIVEAIEKAPTIEIVRCRDCCRSDPTLKEGQRYCYLLDECREDNDFCSYGERKEQK